MKCCTANLLMYSETPVIHLTKISGTADKLDINSNRFNSVKVLFSVKNIWNGMHFLDYSRLMFG